MRNPMNKPDFRRELQLLADSFPRFRPDKTWNELYRAYYDALSGFPLEALEWARYKVVKNPQRIEEGKAGLSALDFPAASELFALCRVYMQHQFDVQQREITHSRFKEMPHECIVVDSDAGKANSARLMLHSANAYEGVHVLCEGQPKCVCPICGCQHGPYENPFIVKLMERYPHETKGWNSFHKGLLLCHECSRR